MSTVFGPSGPLNRDMAVWMACMDCLSEKHGCSGRNCSDSRAFNCFIGFQEGFLDNFDGITSLT